MCELARAGLGKRGFDTSCAFGNGARRARAALAEHDFDVVVTDLHMRGMNGIELCERIVANRPDVPVIVITAFGSLETAVAAIRAGAYDFITKPFEIDALALALERAVAAPRAARRGEAPARGRARADARRRACSARARPCSGSTS